MKVALFVFRRDLRLKDNTGLIAAARQCDAIVPVFLFPDAQISPRANAHFSHAAVQFMCESLRELADDRHARHLLMLRCGDEAQALRKLLAANPGAIHMVICNQDDSVYARERDARLAEACSVPFVAVPNDYGLVDLHAVLNSSGRPYSVLSQFHRALVALGVRAPASAEDDRRVLRALDKGQAVKLELSKMPGVKVLGGADLKGLYRELPLPAQRGGRASGEAALVRARSVAPKYEDTRDFMADERGTTMLSPHLKFGTVSVREAFAAGMEGVGFLRELAFREFYRKIYALDPELQRGKAFREDVDAAIPWNTPESHPEWWRAWTSGRTGVPLVDAGMRQLLQTGWVHNRVRMVVAAWATRYMRFDWRDCARFYYAHLMDADVFSNTAGWHWAAGVGVDSAPYFRRPLHPFRQSQRFDKEGAYIKRWLPELGPVAARDLHRWGEPEVRRRYADLGAYPMGPVLDLREAADESLEVWKAAAKA